MKLRHNIEVWNELADRAAAEITKGTRIQVIGRLRVDEWQDKQSGENRARHKITVDDLFRIAADPYFRQVRCPR